jgi:hypothetical protein
LGRSKSENFLESQLLEITRAANLSSTPIFCKHSIHTITIMSYDVEAGKKGLGLQRWFLLLQLLEIVLALTAMMLGLVLRIEDTGVASQGLHLAWTAILIVGLFPAQMPTKLTTNRAALRLWLCRLRLTSNGANLTTSTSPGSS